MLNDLWMWLENLPLAMHIGESAWFPFLESIHVLAATFVLGSILTIDLRLMNVVARNHAVTILSKELLPWTWSSFLLALMTGAGLFITRASHYAENPAFQIKVVLLVLAGINMLVLHFHTFRSVDTWDKATTPTAAKAAGATSLVIWAAVMLAGRWIGHLN